MCTIVAYSQITAVFRNVISSSIEYMGTIVAYSQITAVFRNVISSSIEYMGTIVAYSHSEFKSYAARF